MTPIRIFISVNQSMWSGPDTSVSSSDNRPAVSSPNLQPDRGPGRGLPSARGAVAVPRDSTDAVCGIFPRGRSGTCRWRR